jgi:hypothetical protein
MRRPGPVGRRSSVARAFQLASDRRDVNVVEARAHLRAQRTALRTAQCVCVLGVRVHVCVCVSVSVCVRARALGKAG